MIPPQTFGITIVQVAVRPTLPVLMPGKSMYTVHGSVPLASVSDHVPSH